MINDAQIGAIIAGANLVCLLFLLAKVREAMRSIRLNHQIRIELYAYRQQLLGLGHELNQRCPHCFRELPEHVEGCDFEDWMKRYIHSGGINGYIEAVTRPPIHYDPERKKKVS